MLWTSLLPFAAGAISALLGAVVNALLTSRREITSRKHAFVTKQLQEFYSPLLGLRQEIRVRSELREKLNTVAERVWPKMVEEPSFGRRHHPPHS